VPDVDVVGVLPSNLATEPHAMTVMTCTPWQISKQEEKLGILQLNICAGQVGCKFVAKSRQQLKWTKSNLWIDTKSNCLRIQMFYRHFTLMIFTLPFLVASLRQLEWFQLNPINPINPSDLLARTTSRVVMPTIFIGSRPSRSVFHGKNGGNQRFQWKTTRPQVEFGKNRKTR
jgi:hypothetical protein